VSDLGSIRHMVPAFADSGSAQWEIKGQPHVMMRLKRIFPKVETKRGGSILLSDTAEIAAEIEWVLGWFDLDVSEEDRAYLSKRTGEHREHQDAVQRILAGERPSADLQQPAVHVDDYQLQAADLALTTGGLICADELGMGKTFTGLLMLRDPRALPALIVVPTQLPRQWQRQLQELLPWLRSHIVRTRTVYDPSQKREMKGHHPDVLIISYSKLDGWADHLAGEVNAVIFDECHELRRQLSAKTKAAGTIADEARFCMGLSGTPVYNYGGEIYNVLDVIAPGKLGSREEFFREWGVGGASSEEEELAGQRGGAGGKKVKARALGHYLREQGLLLRRTWRDVDRERPQQPVKIPHAIDADSEALEEVAGDTKRLAQMILSQATSQKALFAARAELDMRLRQATGIAKAPYVADFVRMLLETEEKVLLFGWHRAVYDYWRDSLSAFNPVLFTGSESKTKKEASKRAFVEGDARVMMMSLRSGQGVDGLQEASNVVVFGELDWSPAMHDQCIGRLARHGQRHQVLAYYLLSNEGSDPAIAQMLNVKRMQSEPIREPDGDLFEPIDDAGDRMRLLAESVLQRRDLEEAA
jgi:SNF2 family DNA or RNA helicase